MNQNQGQTDFGPLAREELEEDGQNDFILPTTDAETAPPADAADGSPNEMRLPPAVAEIQFELRRMTLVVGAWLETTEVRKYAQTIREDLDNLLTKAVQLRSVVEKRTADNANESDDAASSEPRRKVLKRNEESLIRL